MRRDSHHSSVSRGSARLTEIAAQPRCRRPAPAAVVCVSASLLFLLCTAALSLVELVAADGAAHAHGLPPAPTRIRVTAGVLPQSRHVRALARVGPWPHGDTPAHDTAFFREEDDAHTAWMELRRTLLQRPDGPGNEEEVRTTEATQAGPASAAGDGTGAAVTDVATYFRRAAVRARQAALAAATSANATGTRAERLAVATGQVFALRDAVLAASMGRRPGLSALAADTYGTLVERCFAHTTKVVGVSGSPTTPRGLAGAAGRLSLLPSPFIADSAVIASARAELARLQPLFREGGLFHREASVGPDQVPEAKDAEMTLAALRSLLSTSEGALEAILQLSGPLYPDGIATAAEAVQRLRQRIVDNDEATEAQRQALRHLVRARGRLLEWEANLRTGLRYVRRGATVQTVAAAKDFGTETMAAVGLGLIAYERLGCTGGLPALEALPAPSAWAALTALRPADLGLDRRPLLHALLYFSFTTLVLRELRLWMLECALRNAPARAVGRRTSAYEVYRRLYQCCSVTATLLPLLWVLGELLRLQLTGTVPLAVLYSFARPAQRVGIVVAMAVATLAGVLYTRVLHLLPSFIGDPVQRRRRKMA